MYAFSFLRAILNKDEIARDIEEGGFIYAVVGENVPFVRTMRTNDRIEDGEALDELLGETEDSVQLNPQQIEQVFLMLIETIKKELVDVFGPTPTPTKNLIAVAELKTLYKKTPFVYINHENKKIELIANEVEKGLLPSFLSTVSGFTHPQVVNINFKDKKDGRMGVDINLLKAAAAFDVLFSFARLLGVINKG